jgi:tetratricopeptide (TPR) repeat protein
MKIQTLFVGILVTAHLQAADPDSGNSWRLWIERTSQLHREGKLTEAAEAGKRALALARNFGPADSRLPVSYHLLGAIYRDWGHCSEARANLGHAVALLEKQDDANPRYLFNAIMGLITEASECEDFAGAEKLYRTHGAALQRYRSGPLDDAKILALQGGFARGRRRWREAEDYYRRATQILEQTPGSKPSDAAEIRSSLAVILSLARRYEESLSESERSIAALERVDPRYVTLPAALNNEACTLFYLGRKEESQRVYRRALDLATELYGEDNRNTARIMLNYAELLHKNKETPAAEAMKAKGTDAYRRSMIRENQTVDMDQLLGK